MCFKGKKCEIVKLQPVIPFNRLKLSGKYEKDCSYSQIRLDPGVLVQLWPAHSAPVQKRNFSILSLSPNKMVRINWLGCCFVVAKIPTNFDKSCTKPDGGLYFCYCQEKPKTNNSFCPPEVESIPWRPAPSPLIPTNGSSKSLWEMVWILV